VTTQIDVLAAIKRAIDETGTAALYITHDLAVVAQVSDRIMVLRHGKMVEVGTADEVLMRPKTDYARALVNERRSADTMAIPPAVDRSKILIQLDHVLGRYGEFAAVNDVSIDLAKGETVALVGESGSGKSSVARTIVGLLPRESGEITFHGKSLARAMKDRSRDELRRIQLIYQLPDVALNPRQTIGDIIGRPVAFYFGLGKAEVDKRVAELLDQVGLPAEHARRLPGALSGGQKQRVCIARALAAEPEVVICDEPTSALDPLVAEDILKLLRRLQDERGLGYLFITHDLGIVRRIAHRTAVMLRGKIVRQGPTPDVFAPPYDPYTERLLASVPEMRTDWLDEVLGRRPAA
jgi:peptide/nickel transport system ATP-binding protein